MALGGYRIMKAKGDLGEPEWPSLSLSELLDVAFKDRVISSEDHPIFNKLLGKLLIGCDGKERVALIATLFLCLHTHENTTWTIHRSKCWTRTAT